MRVLARQVCWIAVGLPLRGFRGCALMLATLFVVASPSASADSHLGLSHSCIVTATGGVKCAGSNFNGELGNGTTVNSSTPVDVVGLAPGVKQVVAGGDGGGGSFSCALVTGGASTGGVKCWGSNFLGQLGDGTNVDHLAPTQVTGLTSGVIEISAGDTHVCAIVDLGAGLRAVKCWGDNEAGQLGDGTITNRPAPVFVSGYNATSSVNQVDAGGRHTCVAINTGIQCWGEGDNGELGNGVSGNSSVPVSVSGFTASPIALQAGENHTCASDNFGAAKCWGDNFYGELGDGNSNTQSNTPVSVQGLSGEVDEVIAGDSFSCARTLANVVKCWGYNFDGELGSGNRNNNSLPGGVNLDSGALFIAAGRSHACAILDNGAIQCWGANESGQLGTGTDTLHRLPVDVVGLGSGISAVDVDRDSSCALTSAGGVKCWGRNEFTGQVGDGSGINRLTPVDVTGLGAGTTTAIALGARHACALTTATGVKCWGRNQQGELGNGGGPNQSTPVDVTGLTSGVIAIAAGFAHTCALTSTGGMKCWGDGTYGQIGQGSNASVNVPTNVTGLTSGVAYIAAGFQHTCAVTTGGGVKCWGANNNGGLGNGTTTASNVAVDVTGLSAGVSTVEAGTYHSCAKTTSGGIKCWGRNSFGELGDGTFTDRPVPGAVVGLTSGVSKLGVGRPQTCALTNAGALKCWGANSSGAVGDGTTTDRGAPVDVVGLTSGVVSIGNLGSQSCAVVSGGGVKCWGGNLFGQVGDGTNWGVVNPTISLFSLTPAATVDLQQVPPLPVPVTSGSSGASVSAASEIVVVGAPDSDADGTIAGQVFVYTPGPGPGAKAKFREALRSGKSIKAVADLNLATLQMPPELAGALDKFGGAVAVSLDGNTIAVGAPSQLADRGAVYIFKKPVDGWTGKVLPAQPPLTPPAAASGDFIGKSLTFTNAGTIVVGAPGTVVNSQTDAGVVYVIRKGDTTYTMSPTGITSSTPQQGAGFGSSVSGEGSDIVVGAPNQDVSGHLDQGQVQVFREAAGVVNTTPIAVMNDPTATAGDNFGASVAINNGTILVGAPGRDRPAAPDAGAAEVFDQAADGTATPIATLTDPNADAGAALGSSLSLTNGTAVIGAPNADVNGNTDQGGALIYTAPETTSIIGTPIPDGQLFDPFGGAGDHYGTAVYFGGGLLVSGSPNAGTAANKTGKSRKSAKSTAAGVNPGQAIAYSDSVIFKSGMESSRGAIGSCSNPNLPITDNDPAGVTNDLLVTATGNVKDLNVSVRIDHTFVSDLRLTLIHVPSGKTVPLYAPLPAGSCPTDNLDVEFDDQALGGFAKTQCSGASPAIEGRLLPNDWLTIMQGVTRAGPWRLKVVDAGPGDTGTLVSWCVDAR